MLLLNKCSSIVGRLHMEHRSKFLEQKNLALSSGALAVLNLYEVESHIAVC
jgi:hypothetical protein